MTMYGTGPVDRGVWELDRGFTASHCNRVWYPNCMFHFNEHTQHILANGITAVKTEAPSRARTAALLAGSMQAPGMPG